MNAVAKSFKVGRTRLFAFLRDKDILMVMGFWYNR